MVLSVDNSLGEAGGRISNMATRYASAGALTLKVCLCDYKYIKKSKKSPLYIYSDFFFYRK